MAEQTDKSQLFHAEVKTFHKKMHNLLCEQDPGPSLLADLLHAVDVFKATLPRVESVSFRSITERIDAVIRRHSAAGTVQTAIEIETIELAVDWLVELSLLYKENLPEPKSLVAELLYTFDLVERSQDAISLAELVGSHAGTDPNRYVDPFFEDPEFSVQDRPGLSPRDPFAEDPGFGLEFDLLQRTVNFVAAANTVDADPFSADPSIDSEGGATSDPADTSAPTKAPYDIFAGDPPLND